MITADRIVSEMNIPAKDIYRLPGVNIVAVKPLWIPSIRARYQKQVQYTAWLDRDYRLLVRPLTVGTPPMRVAVAASFVGLEATDLTTRTAAEAYEVDKHFSIPDTHSEDSGSFTRTEIGMVHVPVAYEYGKLSPSHGLYPNATVRTGGMWCSGLGKEMFGRVLGGGGATVLNTEQLAGAMYYQGSSDRWRGPTIYTTAKAVAPFLEPIPGMDEPWPLISGPAVFTRLEYVVEGTNVIFGFIGLGHPDLANYLETVVPKTQGADKITLQKNIADLRASPNDAIFLVELNDHSPYKLCSRTAPYDEELRAKTGIHDDVDYDAANEFWEKNPRFFGASSGAISAEIIADLPADLPKDVTFTVGANGSFTWAGANGLQPAADLPMAVRMVRSSGRSVKLELLPDADKSKWNHDDIVRYEQVEQSLGQDMILSPGIDRDAVGDALGYAAIGAGFAPMSEKQVQMFRPLLLPGFMDAL